MATLEVALVSPDDATEPGAVYLGLGGDTWRKVGATTTTTRAALVQRGAQFRNVESPPWRSRPAFRPGDLRRDGATVIARTDAAWVAVTRAPGTPATYTDADVTAGNWVDVGSIFDRELNDALGR